MQKALGYYSFEANVLTINGVRIGNFSEDGGIGYERASAARDSVSSADGYTTAYRLSDGRLTATIEVMETSASYTFLYELYLEQLRAEELSPRAPTFNYTHVDGKTGEEVSSGEAIFLAPPTPNKTRAPSLRPFTILLPYAADSITPAPNNAVQAAFPLIPGI